jgi:hypothetical protein
MNAAPHPPRAKLASIAWLSLAFFAGLVGGCGAPPFRAEATYARLHFTLAHDSPRELATRAQLERLLVAHDVSRYLYTHQVLIDEDSIPHSHPVLTLHARHLDDDGLLLSTFLHEEFHWFTVDRRPALDAAVAELRGVFPNLPVGYPDGANDLTSSYEHLVVNHLEHRALREVLGEDESRRVMQFWRNDHYRALYALEFERGAEIAAVVSRAGLNP